MMVEIISSYLRFEAMYITCRFDIKGLEPGSDEDEVGIKAASDVCKEE